MAKFKIKVHQTIYQHAKLIVEANSQREAEAAARSLVFSGDDSELNWRSGEEETEFDIETYDGEGEANIDAADFGDLEYYLDDCDDPDDDSAVEAMKLWMAKRWRIKLYPKKGVDCEVSIVARDLSHTDAVRAMTEHNDGPHGTWARMEEDVDA